jgi:uracil-DNA glycosylase
MRLYRVPPDDLLSIVRKTINLDCQPNRRTIEVDYERACRMLPPKLQPTRALAQLAPQQTFGQGHLAPQLAGELDRAFRSGDQGCNPFDGGVGELAGAPPPSAMVPLPGPGRKHTSHIRIVRPAAALGRDPFNVLGHVLDVAGLAVDAVLGVDLQARIAFLDADVLIHPRRAVPLLWPCIERQVDPRRHRRVLQHEVARLVFLVVGVRERDAGQAIEGDHAIGLGIGDRLVQVGALRRLAVAVVLHRLPDAEAADSAQPHVRACQHRAQLAAELGHQRLRVLDLLQFLGDPAFTDGTIVLDHVVLLAARSDGRRDGLGRQHPALHRGVAALDARHVDEAGRAPDQRAAGERQARHRLPAALVDRARAIRHAASAFQDRADFRVLLPALEFLERIDVRVGVIERGHEAQCHLVVGLVVEEPAAPRVRFRKRPALRVDDAARHVLFGIDVPKLLDADAIDLRLAIALEIEVRLQPLGQVPARAFGEQRVLGVQFHARLIIGLLRTVLGNAHIAGRDAHDCTVLVEQDLRRREAGEYLDAQFHRLFRKPAAQVAKAAGIVALVRHERRHRPVRHAHLALLRKHPVPVVGHRHLSHRAALLAPFGQEFIQRPGIDHRTRKDVRADFRTLFQDADRNFGVHLLQPDRGGQPCRPPANDDDVIRHRFPFAHAPISPDLLLNARLNFECALKEGTGKVKTANWTGRKDRLPDTANAENHQWRNAVRAALDWWRDAGIDHAFIDDPQDWLAQAREVAATPAPAPMKPLRELAAESREAPPAPRVADRSGWPQTLEAFADWWLAEPALAPAGLRRLPPVGPARADLMIVVPMPSADDGDALLTGRAGRLLDGILAASGLVRSAIYLASAIPAHVPAPDWAAMREAGAGEVLLHHIALVAPKRLLVLGASGISALLGNDPPNLAQSLRAINQEGPPLPALPAWDLEAMLQRPALKAGFWGRWLEWTGTETI